MARSSRGAGSDFIGPSILDPRRSRDWDLGHMHYMYILQSKKDNKFYIGCTNNINRRVKEHNYGLSKFTKGKGPWILKYEEEFSCLAEARGREKQIKSWKKRVAIENLINGAIV